MNNEEIFDENDVVGMANAERLYEQLLIDSPISEETTVMFLESLEKTYPDIPTKYLEEIVDKYNAGIVLESLRANNPITAENTTISSQILAETYPYLTEGALKKAAEEYNLLIYLEDLKERGGEISADSTQITYEHLKATYPNMSDKMVCELRDRYNLLILFEGLKPIEKDSTWLNANDLARMYPEMSKDALRDMAGKYNSEVIFEQFSENGISADSTWLNAEFLQKMYPGIPIDHLRTIADRYNSIIVEKTEQLHDVAESDSHVRNFKLQMNPRMYEFIAPFLDKIPISLHIRNAAELSTEQLESMPNVTEVVIRDGDNTPVSGAQIKPYTRQEYMDSKRVMDKLLEDIPMPQTPEEQVGVVNKVCKRLADHIVYDRYAITEEGKKDSELQKTCRNLYGGLTQGKSVCAGYADILRNTLSCVGIESKYIQGFPKDKGEAGHAWNQVKINGRWFNLDLTWMNEKIRSSEEVPNNILKLDEEFTDHQMYSEYRTRSEKKCNTSLERAVSERSGIQRLRDFTRHCAERTNGIKLTLGEIRSTVGIFRMMQRAMPRTTKRQKCC
ncbi:MAG: transglutaminase domain-containing protein [Clostridia bacterium]|nr:transglutaminase domain-containing protein [Clostridia bacterium]